MRMRGGGMEMVGGTVMEKENKNRGPSSMPASPRTKGKEQQHATHNAQCLQMLSKEMKNIWTFADINSS